MKLVVNHQTEAIKEKISRYFQLLHEWNGRYHLVGKNITHEKIQVQSELMLKVAEQECNMHSDTLVLDIGSGAGLPGILWCILKEVNVCAVELSNNRCSFLRFCAQQLDINLHVECADIRKFQWPNALRDMAENNLIITAQAFASVKTILDYTDHLRFANTKMVLLKSAQVSQELEEAQEQYAFKSKMTSCEYGKILTLQELRLK